MNLGKTPRALGKLLALAALLGGTWVLAQRQASKKSDVTQAPSQATGSPRSEPETARLAELLAERLAAPNANAAPAVTAAAPGQGGVPDDLERVEEFKRQVNERAQQTASLVRTRSDLEPVLAEIERDIERSHRVTAFHAKSAIAAVQAAYRDQPEEEQEARMLEVDRRLMELSAKYDPRVREGLAAGAARQNRFN